MTQDRIGFQEELEALVIPGDTTTPALEADEPVRSSFENLDQDLRDRLPISLASNAIQASGQLVHWLSLAMRHAASRNNPDDVDQLAQTMENILDIQHHMEHIRDLAKSRVEAGGNDAVPSVEESQRLMFHTMHLGMHTTAAIQMFVSEQIKIMVAEKLAEMPTSDIPS